MGTADQSVKVRRLRVRLPAQSLEEVASIFKANLSPGAVFLRVPKELRVKDRVSVEILLADRMRFLIGAGAVTWVGEPSAQGVRAVSCDVEWDAESLPRVSEILARTTIPPPPGDSARMTPEQHVTVDSLPAPAPNSELGTDEITETDRDPTVRVQSSSADLVPPQEQAVTLDESAESPLDAGFATAAPLEPEEDNTVESAVPDFEAWANKAASEDADAELAETAEDGVPEKSGVWRWIKKRLG